MERESEKTMSGNGQPNGTTLEMLAFVVQALMEHEKAVDKLINGLNKFKDEQSAKGTKLTDKMEGIEARVTDIQAKMDKLKKLADAISNAAKARTVEEKPQPACPPDSLTGTQKCRKWEDFQDAAVQADSLRFSYNEEENTFTVEAIKNKKQIIYSGDLPALAVLLKTWFANNLGIGDAESVFAASDKRSAIGEAQEKREIATIQLPPQRKAN